LAHSAVITSSSEFLKERFLSTKLRANDGRLILELPEDLDRKSIDRVLDFMYTGNIAVPELISELMHVIDFLKINSLRAYLADGIRSSSSSSNSPQHEENICYAPSTVDVSEFVTNYSYELMKEEQERIQNLINAKKLLKNPKNRASLIADGFKEWTSLLQEQETKENKIENEVSVPLPPGKTAISVLQEMMQKRGASVPVYKTKGGAGPPFTIVCQIDDMSTEATGNSKKEAKHRAASSMLKNLHENVNRAPGAPTQIKPLDSSKNHSHDVSEVEPKDCLNPVGLLQELMQKNGLQTPEYTPGGEACPPFSWHVRLPHTGQSCTASGNKKAEAKGNAARRMIAQLKEHGLHQPDNHRQPDNHEVNRHPVTELQEYLHQRHIAAPAYQYIPHDGGYEHLKEFTCKCTIDELGLQVKERRKNQKIARKAAATQMLKLIRQEIECSKQISS